MKSMLSWVLAIAVAASAIAAAHAQGAQDAERLLKAAMNTEFVDGNLKAAIEQYQKVVQNGNRPLAAEALLHIAECYQKLGDAESKTIYERIIRDYADQTEAVSIARAHVPSVEATSRAKADRAVWSGRFVDGFGTISPDGRFLTYTDWGNGAVLMLRDLSSGIDRPLTNRDAQRGSGAQYSAISKHGKQVAYEWNAAGKPDELRIVSLSGAGIPEYRRILQNDDIQNVFPLDWSTDGRWIAARLTRKDRSIQIALVSSQDGEVRVLKTTDWSDLKGKLFFSPDGRYLAHAQTSSDSATKSQIFILAVDGSRETAADTFPSLNQVMGWLPDGRHLLFASDRSGSQSLWAVPVTDGKPQGEPVLVKPNIGPPVWSLGVTASGALYTWTGTNSEYLQVASIDLSTGALQGSPMGIFQKFIASRGRPEWSADGQQLAFVSCSTGGAGPCSLFVRSMQTGQVREVRHQLNYFSFMTWSPDGRELLVGGTDTKGKSAFFRIAVESGATSVFVDGGGYAQWAPDGKAIYYKPGRRDVILRRDLASGAESELVRAPGGSFAVSPDGRSIAEVSTEGSASDVLIIPLEAGQTRSLLHVNAPEHIRNAAPVALSWTPDSRAVIAMKTFDDNRPAELWHIPIDGRQPRKLDIDTEHWSQSSFRLSPDGKLLAFVGTAGRPGTEIWALENVTPPSRSIK
jgi:Tol biopolymer transport system component